MTNYPKTLLNTVSKAPLSAGIVALADYTNGTPCSVCVDRLVKIILIHQKQSQESED